MSGSAGDEATAEANARAATAMVSALAQAGLRRAVICPGSRSAPLVLALHAHPAITLHTVLDERAAGFLALGAARVDGRAVALIATSGSAATHFFPAVVEASYSRVPLLVLSADRPSELLECGAGQTIDQTRLFGEHARWFFALQAPEANRSVDWIATIAAQAWHHAHGINAGPVHLDLPFREPLWSPQTDGCYRDPTPQRTLQVVEPRPRLDDETLQRLATELAGAERGVIVCGPIDPAALGGITGQGIAQLAARVTSLAEQLGWPLLADPGSQLRFGERPTPNLIRSADAILTSPAARRALQPDLVLRLGQTPTSKAINTWLDEQGRGRVILVDPSGRVFDPAHAARTLLVAEPSPLCDALAALLERRDGDASLRLWLAAEAAARSCLDQETRSGLWEGGVARQLAEALPQGALLQLGNSMPIRDIDAFAGDVARDITVLVNRGANGIDGTLATAGGTALASERKVIALLGDLAFLHDSGGLAAIGALEIDLTIVVLANGGGGIFEFLPIADHPTAFTDHFLAPQPTGLEQLCAASAARWQCVSERAQLAPALYEAINHPGVAVLEVTIDRAANVSKRRQALERVDQALATALPTFAEETS